MQINNITPKTKNKKVMLVGRGGKRGKTSGRGTKGQNARAGRKKRPELRDFIKRLPKLRGRGVSPFKSISTKPFPVSLKMIADKMEDGALVSPQTLFEKGIVEKRNGNIKEIKILGSAEISKKLIIERCTVSEGAKAMILKAGGTIK